MIDKLFDKVPVKHLAKCDYKKTGLNWSVFLDPADLLSAAQILYKAEYSLEDLTAIDGKEGYLVVYHFVHMTNPNRVALRVLASHDDPCVPSIAPVFHGAEWHERETMDFYGVMFDGNPNPVPLLLAPEMTEHPLQKAEAARVALAEMVPAGEVIRSAPDFDLLTSKAATGA